MLDRNALKNVMAIGDENSITTKRTMGKESRRMEPRTQYQNQDMQSSGETKEKMGRRNQRLSQTRGNRSNLDTGSKAKRHVVRKKR